MEILPNHLDCRPYSARPKINLLFCFVNFPDLELERIVPHADARRAQTRARDIIHVTSRS